MYRYEIRMIVEEIYVGRNVKMFRIHNDIIITAMRYLLGHVLLK